MKAGEKMLIATPQIINKYVNQIPSSYLDMKTMIKDLALSHNADVTCPVTTGIFLRIVAEFAYEQHKGGKTSITPFWRVVNPRSDLAKKLACGPAFIQK